MGYTSKQLKQTLSKSKSKENKRVKQSRLKHAGKLTKLWDKADRDAVLANLCQTRIISKESKKNVL